MSIHFIAVGIAFSVIKGLAVLLTLFRLGLRWKMQQLWWEDMWAAIALSCLVTSMLCAFITFTEEYESRLAVGRIEAYMFTCITWFVRMSLMFSIIRIAPWSRLRRIMLAVTACFFVFWAVSLSLQAWWCVAHSKESTPSASTRPICVILPSIVIFEITASFVADMTALALSFKLLWPVKLPLAQRIMILWLFSVSRFLCTFSLAHSISELVGSQGVQEILGDIEVAAFMIICNLAVIVTYIYRVFWRSPSHEKAITSPPKYPTGEDDQDFNTPTPSRATQILTTVDLDLTIDGNTTLTSAVLSYSA